MRSLVNKVFTPRAVTTLKPVVTETIERFLSGVNPDRFDVAQDFSGHCSRWKSSPRMARCAARTSANRVREWIDDTACTANRVRSSMYDDRTWRPTSKIAMHVLLRSRSRNDAKNPQDDMISATDRCRGRPTTMVRLHKSRRSSKSLVSPVLLGGAGAESRSPSWWATQSCVFAQQSRPVAEGARRPQQDPGCRRRTAALCRPGTVQRPLLRQGR